MQNCMQSPVRCVCSASQCSGQSASAVQSCTHGLAGWLAFLVCRHGRTRMQPHPRTHPAHRTSKGRGIACQRQDRRRAAPGSYCNGKVPLLARHVAGHVPWSTRAGSRRPAECRSTLHVKRCAWAMAVSMHLYSTTAPSTQQPSWGNKPHVARPAYCIRRCHRGTNAHQENPPPRTTLLAVACMQGYRMQ